MTYIKTWEDFEKAGERLYLQEPTKVRYTMKYTHSKNQLVLKMTDDVVVSLVLIIMAVIEINTVLCLF